MMADWQLGYKKLYRDEDLIKIAEKLIKKQGLVTAFNISNQLKEEHFWATCNDVETAMNGLCDDGVFQHDFNEPRHYFLPL